jgi:hypothetical protein
MPVASSGAGNAVPGDRIETGRLFPGIPTGGRKVETSRASVYWFASNPYSGSFLIFNYLEVLSQSWYS